MTDPYRTAGLVCPHCPGVSLREYQHRYCCDECDGILIGFDDFKSAVADLRDEEVKLVYDHETPSALACPLCEKRFVESRMKVELTTKTVKVRAHVLRCDHDGLWLSSGTLADVFARVPKRWGGGPSYEGARTTGLDGLPIHRVGGAVTDGLRISDWRSRPRRRAQTLTPVNAYKDLVLICPACPTTKLAFMGDRYACSSCDGSFVENAAMIGMVSDVTNAEWTLPPSAGAAGKRSCPICAVAMTVEITEGVTLDRCVEHGVWFDAGELAGVLEHAGIGSLGGWLKRLFSH